MVKTKQGAIVSPGKSKEAGKPPAKKPALVMTVPEAGELLGLSREASYQAAKPGGVIPVIRIGRLLKVPTVRFYRMLEGEQGARVVPAFNGDA